MIRIALIEPKNLFLNSLENLINSFDGCQTVIAEKVFNSKTPILYKDRRFDLIILSVSAIDDYCIKTMQEINAWQPVARLILLTNNVPSHGLTELLKYNVHAIFSKSIDPMSFERTLTSYNPYDSDHEIKIDQTLRNQIFQQKKERGDKLKFTAREKEILTLVCMEKTNHEISDILGLSIRTIESFRRRMIMKANCKTMIGVIMKASGNNNLSLNY